MILPIILLSFQTFSHAQSLCKWPCLVLHGQNDNLVATPSAFPHEICKPIWMGTCVLLTSDYGGVGERDIYPYDRSAPMGGQHPISSHVRAFEPSFLGSSLGHLDVLVSLNCWSSTLKRKLPSVNLMSPFSSYLFVASFMAILPKKGYPRTCHTFQSLTNPILALSPHFPCIAKVLVLL